jgi:heptosyltransferase-2
VSIPQNKILVIRGGAIGDFILTLPVLAALRTHFPKTSLELLGYPHIAQLARAGKLVDAVHSIEARPMAGFFARGGQLNPPLADFFSSFAVIISYLYDPDRIFQENVARVSKAQFIAGPHRPDERVGIHATEVFLQPLMRLAIFDADPVPRLRVSESSWHRSADSLAARTQTVPAPMKPTTLGLHPGSGSEKKNWPEANWRELIQKLSGARLVLVGGEAEEGRLERLAEAAPCELARSLPLAELAARLSNCSLFVGHDSGISHLAAAIGTPTIVLWGDTAETVWRPLGERVTIIKGLADISVDAVFQAVQASAG